MKKIILLTMLTTFLMSCDIKNKKKTVVKVSDSSVSHTKKLVISDEITPGNLADQIKGRWGSLRDTTASFSIDKKEIFYYDATASYPYSLVSNKIKIKYDDYAYIGFLKMIGRDTLIMIGTGKFHD